jgi:hypothetical protein
METERAPAQNFEIEKWRTEHALELKKWRADVDFRTREADLKEREQYLRDQEVAIKREEVRLSKWTNPLVLSIFGAAFAGLVNAGLSWWNNRYQFALEDNKSKTTLSLEQSKSEATRILEMIKTDNPDRAAENLAFLVDAGLISDQTLVKHIRATRKSGTGPYLSSSQIRATIYLTTEGDLVL